MFGPEWDQRFLTLASQISAWSKDPSTKVGAVIVRPDKTIASVGYNGFPAGIDDTPERLSDRDTKLGLIVHGEINAILRAREVLTGYTIYLWPFLSCCDCAKVIITTGIKRVVAPICNIERWQASFERAKAMYEEAGVQVDLLEAA